MRDYQGSVTTGQTYAGQSDPYVPQYFAGNTKRKRSRLTHFIIVKCIIYIQFSKFLHGWNMTLTLYITILKNQRLSFEFQILFSEIQSLKFKTYLWNSIP